ncbi:hypothetical protein [Methylocystis sp.]|uniref:hypothetical protein n=1 Tax=Methylocystis sp. TaxID=1911079 RepID=UPI003DA612EE
MDKDVGMSTAKADMREVVAELPKALYRSIVRNTSAFVSTGVTYPNGVGVAVRIDEARNGYTVSDDGYASQIAETMGAATALNRIAGGFAQRCGVSFEKGVFLLEDISRDTLPVAVGAIANSSARAMERLVASLEQPRLKRSRALFDKRLQAAFGKKVRFDLEFKGATGRNWEFDAGVEDGGSIVHLFALVSPTTQAVALANMKISDSKAIRIPPVVTAALVDYDRTEPALRSILSQAGGIVIPANADVTSYQLDTA